VQDIIQGYGAISNIDRQAAQEQLARAQETRLNTLLPEQVTQIRAGIEAEKQRVANEVARTEILKQLAPLQQEDIRSTMRARQIASQLTQAQIPEVGAARRQAEQEFSLTHTPVQTSPNVPPVYVPGTSIIQSQIASEQNARELAAKRATVEHQTAVDYRKQEAADLEDSTKAEELIQSHPSNVANVGNIDLFNTKSSKPYIYAYPVAGTIYNSAAAKIPLVDASGRKYRAKDIARIAAAQDPPMTVQEYVEKVLYQGRKLP